MVESWQQRSVWLMRIALVVALAVTVAFPHWEQFEGKGMAFRAPFYALPLIVTPLVWLLRGRRPPYPWLVDAAAIAPFLADTLGNILGFYNRYNATDDVLHFLNWIFLAGGVTLALARTGIGRLNAWTLAYGIGAVAIIWWETAEFLVAKAGTAGLQLTYADTIGDLVLSSTGGALGALLVTRLAWPPAPAGRAAFS
jgi:hypothetical protein